MTYDIYILDIEMQGMNGLELAKTIRTNEPNALIIFLTSYSEYVFDVFEVITFDFWSYVKKKYKLNTTNFLFLCNC